MSYLKLTNENMLITRQEYLNLILLKQVDILNLLKLIFQKIKHYEKRNINNYLFFLNHF